MVEYPSVDRVGAKGMRDVISHQYFDLNADIVFDV
ncbi:HepT-like ribonuclease domain-containing protein [Desulfopila sp. IMCC35008]